MIDDKTVRRLALSFPEAVELPHWGNPSYRVGKRIFATLGEYEGQAVLKIPVDEQEVLLEAMPDVFVVNAWSKQGWLGVRLEAIEADLFEDLLERAWRSVAPKRAIRAHELGARRP